MNKLQANLGTFGTWFRAFVPAAQTIGLRERLRASFGGFAGILVAALGALWTLHGTPMSAALVAPLGASAVLVFAVPSSPLAQPWSVLGGNTVSALVGIACFKWIPGMPLAAALAVGGAIAAMFALRCLHPPGGAAALLMVLTQRSHFSFAFDTVMLDCALLIGAGLLYNNLTRRRWPHAHNPAPRETPGARLTQGDLDAALTRYDQVLDISRDDLRDLLQHAQAAAYQRTVGDLRCADVMTAKPVTARAEMSLRHAWSLMRKHHIKALPVIDGQHHLIGIVTLADFMRQVDLEVHEGMAWRLRAVVRQMRGAVPARVVGQIMTRQVRVASSDRPLLDLVPVFSDGGHRHIPIIDAERRLVGIITQSDLIGALSRAW